MTDMKIGLDYVLERYRLRWKVGWLVSNPNCDGAHCCESTGEVRLLPTGGGGNMILCVACYAHELLFRQDRNRDIARELRFDLPAWLDLEIYAPKVCR